MKSGKACEFEVFIKPLCSCELNDHIKIIALDIRKGKQLITEMPIHFNTEISTRLDYYELIQEKKLGEGSFGIVFLGTFRGNKVAIKKIKTVNQVRESMEEFEKEVAMLDKFRSDYIIHFYGACFLPGKLCMVTEFAEYGSIQDLIYKRPNENEITPKLKTKILLDAAKGVQYLHENGILHRDIKPDNFLVISIKENVSINAKLTDFGSARNVNLLMTNMTFTKGIGTPKYMSPEMLNKQHYKTYSDVFSFAITMYEVFSWKEAYQKSQFKFPWKIAEFITSGMRLNQLENITDEQYQLICNCWCHDPKERLTFDGIVEELDKLLNLY